MQNQVPLSEAEALSSELRRAYQLAQREIDDELASILSLPQAEQARRFRRQLERSISERPDQLDAWAATCIAEDQEEREEWGLKALRGETTC